MESKTNNCKSYAPQPTGFPSPLTPSQHYASLPNTTAMQLMQNTHTQMDHHLAAAPPTLMGSPSSSPHFFLPIICQPVHHNCSHQHTIAIITNSVWLHSMPAASPYDTRQDSPLTIYSSLFFVHSSYSVFFIFLDFFCCAHWRINKGNTLQKQHFFNICNTEIRQATYHCKSNNRKLMFFQLWLKETLKDLGLGRIHELVFIHFS